MTRRCRHDGGSRHRSTGHRGSGLGSAQTEPTASDQPTGGTGGALAGLKGTTPLVELSQEFQDKLLAIDLSLGTTFNYAAETYDAINIIALAVEKAKTDGIDYAKEINGITRDGEKCTDFATCKAIIDANGDPDYDGQSGPLEFAGTGEPLQASFGVLTFGDDNRIDNSATTFIEASAAATPMSRRCPSKAPGPVTAHS